MIKTEATWLTLQNILLNFFLVVKATLRGFGLFQRLLVLRRLAGCSGSSCRSNSGAQLYALQLLWSAADSGRVRISYLGKQPDSCPPAAAVCWQRHSAAKGTSSNSRRSSREKLTAAPRTFTQPLRRYCQPSSVNDVGTVISLRPRAVTFIAASHLAGRRQQNPPSGTLTDQLRSRPKVER